MNIGKPINEQIINVKTNEVSRTKIQKNIETYENLMWNSLSKSVNELVYYSIFDSLWSSINIGIDIDEIR